MVGAERVPELHGSVQPGSSGRMRERCDHELETCLTDHSLSGAERHRALVDPTTISEWNLQVGLVFFYYYY